jgi:hypothetical protein
MTAFDYNSIKSMAKSLGRPAYSLIALASCNDPFWITPSRQAGAKWFGRIWQRFGLGRGVHCRRVHYQLISQKTPVKMPDGTPYENTVGCWQFMCEASRDARYLNIVPAHYFIDRRNDEPLIHLADDPDEALIMMSDRDPCADIEQAKMPSPPTLNLSRPTIPQRYHIEIWCEKTTVNDVLEPLAEEYGLNVVTGSGELSQTACVNVVKRAQHSGRPVCILYISDFDPAGQSMPVAVARKIEHRLYLMCLGHLNIQVRPIVLTLEQCEQYSLPRTPIKDTEKRATVFEDRYGEGATELDALEATHPGELKRIIETEIDRHYDSDLDGAVDETASELEDDLAEITRKVHAKHKAQIKTLELEWKRVAKEYSRQVKAWLKRAKPIWSMRDALT